MGHLESSQPLTRLQRDPVTSPASCSWSRRVPPFLSPGSHKAGVNKLTNKRELQSYSSGEIWGLRHKFITDWHAILSSGFHRTLTMLGIQDWRVYSWKRWHQMVLSWHNLPASRKLVWVQKVIKQRVSEVSTGACGRGHGEVKKNLSSIIGPWIYMFSRN